MGTLKLLIKQAYRYRKRYFIGIFFLLLIDFIQLIPPKLIGYLTDLMSSDSANSSILFTCIIYILLIYLVIAFGRYMWRIYIFGTARILEYDMRNELFIHFQKLSLNFYNQNKTGDLMALSTNDLNAVRMALGNGIVMLTDSIVLTVTTIIIMLSINVRLALLSLIPLPLVALVAAKFGKMIHKRFLKVQQSFSKLTDMVQENFSGIRVVKSFVQESREYEKFTAQNQSYFKTNMSLVRVSGVFFPLIEFISSLSFVLLMGIGGTYVIYGYLSLGDFITFNMYLGSLIWPMMAVGWVINTIQRGLASFERIQDILNKQPEIFDRSVNDVTSIKGEITIKDLTFTYPGVKYPSLKNINIQLKEGQTLGIIGKTGSGKSTLVNLLVRLYDVPDNHIIINGCDINKIPLKILRENTGFVTQEAFLFSANISENINLAFDDLNFEKIVESAKASDIYDNIMDFSEKFDTVIGERGVTLSGGQKQRLSISRALIKNPELLIFDDCLSAVDAKTEVKILDNLKRIMQDRTSIIISHRISAVKDADLIVVLDEGEIKESGTHRELVNKDGLYRSIYEKQQIEEKLQEEV